jgi:hypothetical protein
MTQKIALKDLTVSQVIYVALDWKLSKITKLIDQLIVIEKQLEDQKKYPNPSSK